MNRSESQSYLMYGRAFAYGNYRKSLSCLLDFVSENQKQFELCERADMIHRIGDVYYHLGDIGLALFFYQIGLDCDPGSLSPKLRFAKFVGRRLNDIDQQYKFALKLSRRPKQILKANPKRSQVLIGT